MLLHDLSPQPLSTLDHLAIKRRQLQHRRRTLQTISELSIPDGTTLNIEPTAINRIELDPNCAKPRLRKRQSLPQYCGRPSCVNNRSASTSSLWNAALVQSAHNAHTTHEPKSSKNGHGWNARRERAMAQQELSLAHSGLGNSTMSSGGYGIKSCRAPALHSLDDLGQSGRRSCTGGHQSLRKKTQSFGKPPSLERWLSLGALPDCDTEDSNSYRSTRHDDIRRSRSGSSSRSSTSQTSSAMLVGLASPVQRSHAKITKACPRAAVAGQWYDESAMYQVPWSQPSSLSGSFGSSGHQSREVWDVNNQRPRRASTPQNRHHDKQWAREQSLAALTESSQQSLPRRHASDPSSTAILWSHADGQPARYHAPRPTRRATAPSRRRSTSMGLMGMPSAMENALAHNSCYKTTTHYHHRPTCPQSQTQPASTCHPNTIKPTLQHRIPPARESLMRWKEEREEARAEIDGLQRAKIRERVRMANELEVDKETELRAQGRPGGQALVEEVGKQGCFGPRMKGMWGRLRTALRFRRDFGVRRASCVEHDS